MSDDGNEQPNPLMQGYVPRAMQNPNMESIMNKHMDVSETLDFLQKTLMGFEYNPDDDEWKPITIFRGYDTNGVEMNEIQGPLMETTDIMILINFLKMHLNPNTFLTYISDKDKINDIMFQINLQLASVFYRLNRSNISKNLMTTLWLNIDNAILFGISRGDNKVTLDAVTKTQHSVEYLDGNKAKEQKEFKMFGW